MKNRKETPTYEELLQNVVAMIYENLDKPQDWTKKYGELRLDLSIVYLKQAIKLIKKL